MFYLSQAAAAHMAPGGSIVNTASIEADSPWPEGTPLISSTMPPEKAAPFRANTPLDRPGQRVEVAPAYVFFASDAASYITGAALPVTGGRTML